MNSVEEVISSENNLGNLIDLGKNLEKIAVYDLEIKQECSYQKLEIKANQFAHGLKNLNIGKGDRVAIHSLNSLNFVIAYLGILRVGAVAVMINIKFPKETIDYILKDSDVKFIITDKHLFTDIPQLNLAYINTFFKDGDTLMEPVKKDDPAVILYTSGSTSLPKGVVLSHNHKWIIRDRSKDPIMLKVRRLVSAPFYHMHGLSVMETSLSGHSFMVIMPRFEPMAFLLAIEKFEINYVTAIPTMMALALEEKYLLEKVDLSSVRYIMLASAPVSPALWYKIKGLFPKAHLVNAYGSTEAGPGLFQAHPTLTTPDLSVGYPTPGIEYRLVDSILQVRSPSMMLGYNKTNNENLTEDGFFITNDIFRVDENGFYYFISRADDMFVSGGNNVYPGQIEMVIETHSGVISSAVIGIDDDLKGVKPYAFVVLKNKSILESELKEHILKILPPSHCPRKIWILENMPMNGVGKIDKKKLKEDALALLNIPHGENQQ